MPTLNLTADQMLATTRSVRKRLDFTRPVEPAIIRECLDLALQAPTGGNRQGWQWLVVTDAATRQTLGDLYRKGWAHYLGLPINQPEMLARLAVSAPERAQALERIRDSSTFLAEHMHEAPVLVIPCIMGRPEGASLPEQAGLWGSILPAAWSFMLAARARGLGSAWTTVHLYFEREAAEVLGIAYERVTQAALIPVAYTHGTEFAPAKREPLERVLHWDHW